MANIGFTMTTLLLIMLKSASLGYSEFEFGT